MFFSEEHSGPEERELQTLSENIADLAVEGK